MIATRVTGLDRLKRRLERIPRAARKAAREAMEKNANELVAMQKRLAPVDKGDLRDSIKWRDGEHALQIKVVAGGGDGFHATFQEFGTIEISAQPFFFPAYRASKKRMAGRVKRSIRKAIKTG